MKNGTGYRQGCVLVALLFCLVLHVTLLDVAARTPGLYISAFVDDTKFLGDNAMVPTALGVHAGLYALLTRGAMNLDKYEVYSPAVPLEEVRAALSDNAGLPDDMTVSSAGIVVCGGPIGTPDFVAEFVREQVVTKAASLPYVQAMESIQNQCFFLSNSLTKNFVHVMRLTPCGEDSRAGAELAKWDAQLSGLLEQIVGTRELDGFSRDIATLSQADGGIGLTTTVQLADPCFVAGKLATARIIDGCAPFDLAITSLLDLSTDPTYAVETGVHLAISRLDEIKPGLRGKLTASAPNGAIRQQRALRAEISGALKADVLVGRDNDFDPRTRALLRSNAGNPHVFCFTARPRSRLRHQQLRLSPFRPASPTPTTYRAVQRPNWRIRPL